MAIVKSRFVVAGLAVAFVGAASSPALAQLTYNPVATTGHDQDIVFEKTLNVGDPGANGELGSRQLYEEGIVSTNGGLKPGLLQSMTGFVSTITLNTINYNFNPFNENNILKFDNVNTTTRALTLTTPAAYSNLAIVYSGGSLNATGNNPSYQGVLTYTIHYQGGATQTGAIKAGDWGTGFPLDPAVELFYASGRSSANTTTWNGVTEAAGNPGRWRILVTEIATTNSAIITSIDFGNPQQHANATPEVLDPLGTATPTGGTTAIIGADVVVFGIAGATGGGGGTFNIADFNHMNGVDGADLAILKGNFGKTGTANNADGDTDIDFDVDGNDFLKWQQNVGKTSAVAAATSAPEPSAGALAALTVAGAGLVCRRRRAAGLA
jgi:hypothetical protein